VVATFAALGKHAEVFYDLLAALDKLGSLASLEVEDPSGESPAHEARPAACELLGLSQRGQGAASVYTTLGAGTRVRLVGGSDGERESLLRTLYGLDSAREGHVRIDGLDARDLSLDALRERVGLVLVPELWSGSILDNLKHEAPDADLISVRKALEALDLSDELSALPEALGTHLTPGGGTLSFGQSLRLTLARAYLRQPQVLLIGNAIDALDPGTRRCVVEALAAPTCAWTLIIASHDEALDAHCTHVLDLNDGTLEALA
jgi:ABC-type multidrug transport system fused ATPase/permease subunit